MIKSTPAWTDKLKQFDWNRTDPYDPEELLNKCKEAVIAGFYGTNHPLAHRWIDGALQPDQLRFMAMQEYWYFRCTVWWNAGKVLHCPDLEDQRALLGPLMEEAGIGGVAHEQQFIRYMEGLGIDMNEVRQAGVLPQTIACVDEFYNLNKHGHLIESLAANNIVAELMRPRQYPLVLKAFAEHYQWVPTEALEFFRTHAEADVEHAALGERLFKKYAATIETQQLAWAALTRSLAVRWCFYDGILNALDSGSAVLLPIWHSFPVINSVN